MPVLVKMSLYASIDLIEASMLGRCSVDVEDHFVGEVESDRSIAGLASSTCCDTKEGFLLRTLRDVLVLNSGTAPSTLGLGFANPNLDAVPARGPFDSGECPALDKGSLILGRGSDICCDLPPVCTLLESGRTPSLLSCLRPLEPDCAYIPGILLPLLSPVRDGGS